MKYLDANELKQEVTAFKNTNEISIKLGYMLRNIAQHMLGMPSFVRYPNYLKEDMVSQALYKCIKALKTVKADVEPKSMFSYFTRTCWCGFLEVLTKYYKQQNIKRNLTISYLNTGFVGNENLKQQLLAECIDAKKEFDKTGTKRVRKCTKKKNVQKGNCTEV